MDIDAFCPSIRRRAQARRPMAVFCHYEVLELLQAGGAPP